MGILRSAIAPDDADFRANAAHHRGLAATLAARLQTVAEGGSAPATALQRGRGKLPVRQRVASLLDAETPWLELGALAAWGCHTPPVPAAGLVTGIGRIEGRLCMIVANDPTVKGGTYFPETIKKHLRAQEIALENLLPCIYLADSGGIFLPLQAQVFADREHFGRIFYNQAQMSARGIAQIAVVLGMCTAGGAYVPAMADENIIVAGAGTIYLAGPPLVKAATGETVSAEELGGGEMHSRVSGVTDHLVASEAEALARCREVVANLGPPPLPPTGGLWATEAPLYPATDLYGILPADNRHPFDVHEVIARLVDGSRYHAFKANYGTTLSCGFARLFGRPVGIVANAGVLFGDSAQKGAHFVQLCGQRQIPLLFLQNVTGFMVGKRYEQGGIAKDGAKMVQAVATVQVPKLTLIIGASHGAGNYAMCGRGFMPRFVFSWPNARISVMGARQAAEVLVQVKAERLQALGTPLSAAAAAAIAAPVREQYELEGDPYFASARLWDDGIIDPAQTREILGLALTACWGGAVPPVGAPVYRM